MKLIAQKYRKLFPTKDYLNDEVVMTQAWKKTHAYIRSHNWYADTLALDVSALSLEGNVRNWAASAVDEEVGLEPMELIPAAKSEAWVVDDIKGWCPKNSLDQTDENIRQEKPPLRPLAHLTIRDQTWATASLLCLADIVETEQGDCAEQDFLKAQSNKVYSYGNRLLCDWKEDGCAWFRWGNSQLYRKFFTDYQNFLRRPVAIGHEVAQVHTETDYVYVVSLDLARFYDTINRASLRSKLRKLCSKQTSVAECPEFWTAFDKMTSWQWDAISKQRIHELHLDLTEKQGIPQGLVAAGFFANAYLLDFDQAVGQQIGKAIPHIEGITLHDYCRYVDDIRLVVSIDEIQQYGSIGDTINNWLKELLEKKAGKSLSFNTGKTNVTALSELDNKGSLSERVAQLQNELSGPADRDILDSTMGALEGLLTLREDDLPSVSDSNPDAALVRIAKLDQDVRSDTLKRFAANRLEAIMRNKRKIDIPTSGGATDIDNQSELLAKRLILAWIQDPSLALVLRKALEIYPSTTLAEPVFDSILNRCSFWSPVMADKISSAMADYLLADLFRCCIDFHSYFQRIDYPASADPTRLQALACRYAQKALNSNSVPAFVERQALLLLAINQKPATLPNEPETIHQHLHALLVGQAPPWKHQLLALYEVATQITGSPDTFAGQLIETAESQSKETQIRIFDELAKRGGPFWLAIWQRLQKSNVSKDVLVTVRWAAPTTDIQPKGQLQNLARLLSSMSNPFVHEAAFVKLALALSKLASEDKTVTRLSPAQIKIKKSGKQSWQRLWEPSISLNCLISNQNPVYDPRFQSPSWLAEDAEASLIYWIGSILRSAATGAIDFTGSRWRPSDVQSYKGLRTGWYKRRMGMMHAPEALVGEFGTLSSWASELLMKCLQWPGFESTHLVNKDIAGIDSIVEFKRVLKERLELLNNLVCRAIDTPALITTSRRPHARYERGFRLVSVQQLLPNTADFSRADPKLDNPLIKAANRDHLARVCQITYRTLEAKLAAEKKQSYPGADLIVFPELAVHPDDQDLLKRLADKTQAMIFAGLTFVENDGRLINIARWFIPDYRDTGRQWVIRDQGKANPMHEEVPLGVVGYRPCQHIIEVYGDSEGPFRITGAICYDSTDLKLASDLKHKTDLLIIVAHHQDVRTFDAMASALNYHMYQHVVVVNKGEFGGSTMQAPYKEQYERLISHAHGANQISINVADLDLAAFKRKNKSYKKVKTPPAG